MTETDVCNLALGTLGHDRVISGDFRSATSTEAMRCRLFYDISRKAVLSSDGHHWKFAETKVNLDLRFPHCEYGADAEFPFLYELPPDVLNIIRVHKTDDEHLPVDFLPYATGVYCGEERATVIYVYDVTDVNAWPALPLDALTYELAARLAGPMTGDADKIRAAKKDAKAVLRNAQLWNAKQFNNKPSGDNRYAASHAGCSSRRN